MRESFVAKQDSGPPDRRCSNLPVRVYVHSELVYITLVDSWEIYDGINVRTITGFLRLGFRKNQ